MTYSIMGIVAAIVLVIINRDALWETDGIKFTQVQRNYRWFLFGVMAYYITDMLWGILYSGGLIKATYADTFIHFIAMAAAVFLWTRYVVSYLEERSAFGTVLNHAGWLFMAFQIIALIVNFFRPVMFSFDAAGEYQAGIARYILLAIQIALFLMTSVYTLVITSRTEGKVRRRHLTIGLFGIAMVALMSIQVFYPLLPFYAIGYMLGTCVLHTFVVEDEKEEYRIELEEILKREQLQAEELQKNRETLKDALDDAERANRAKTSFLSNMSHEIRTPMNAIIGLNNIAMNEPTASEGVKGYLEKIGDSAHHLLGIIEGSLEAAHRS